MSSEKKMKRYVITEYGQEELIHIREFVVEVPEGCDPEALDGGELSEVAEKAEVAWDVEDCTGICHDRYYVERLADEVDCGDLPVFRVEIDDDKEDFDD